MSRSSIRTFLSAAKKHLQQCSKDRSSASFVVCNESADLDSITCALVYGYIQSSTLKFKRNNDFLIPITNIPAADLPLRPELSALLRHADLKPSDLITLDDIDPNSVSPQATEWTLVDHNALTGMLAEHYSSRLIGVIDHHDDETAVPREASPRIIQKAGSCNSLMIDYARPAWDELSTMSSSIGAAHGQDDKLIDDFAYTSTWDAQVAKLSLAAILIDTSNLNAESKVTEVDRKAVRYLEARINSSRKLGKDYDRDRFFGEIDAAKRDLDGLSLVDLLRKDYKAWSEGGMQLGVASVVKPLEYLLSKEDDLISACVEFASERKLGLFAIMTAYADEASGRFSRQLVLIALDDGKTKTAAQKFVEKSSDELQLEESNVVTNRGKNDSYWWRTWQQGNVDASRKQVAPMLREAMKAE